MEWLESEDVTELRLLSKLPPKVVDLVLEPLLLIASLLLLLLQVLLQSLNTVL
jgi:hypothetical protein